MGLMGARRAMLLSGAALPAPSLDLDFLQGTIPSGVTFTRASSAWTFDGTTLAAYATNAPRLTGSGLLIEEARTNLFLNSAVGVTQSVTVAAVANTLSFYGTGTITLTGTSTAGPLVGTSAADRVSLTFTPTAGSLTLTVSGSATNVQLEAGSFASSVIVTVGASVTRALDLASVTTLTPWYSATAGTLFAETSSTNVNSSSTAAALHDGTSNNLIGLRYRSGVPLLAATLTTAGVAQISIGGTPSYTTGAVSKLAIAYQADDVAVFYNGAVGITDSSATIPTVTTLHLGGRNGGAEPLNGYVRRARFYQRRLDTSALQKLTT